MSKQSWIATIIRVVLGTLFMAHGVDKFQTGLGNVASWFDSVGVPEFMAYITAVLELVGGFLLIVGLFTRLLSGLFVLLMAGAIATVKWKAGLLNGYELDIAYILASLSVAAAAPSALSLDHLIRRGRGSAAHVHNEGV